MLSKNETNHSLKNALGMEVFSAETIYEIMTCIPEGKVDIMKLRPIIFHSADASYHVVGDSVGQAWNTGKKYE